MREETVRTTYRAITKALIRQNLTITTMESCTGGQIASLITDTEGSSAVLKGAFVTYCNEAKIMQGVPEAVISQYGVYSAETAQAMAQACRKAYKADIGVGITGTMGNPDPANADSIPGEVYFAVVTESKAIVRHVTIEGQPSRLLWKLAAAQEVAEVLLEVLDAGL